MYSTIAKHIFLKQNPGFGMVSLGGLEPIVSAIYQEEPQAVRMISSKITSFEACRSFVIQRLLPPQLVEEVS